MSANIHYHVYSKKNRKSGWRLLQATETRQEALEIGEIYEGQDEISLRVTRESFDTLNEIFLSSTIFSVGPEQHQRRMRDDVEMEPTCSTPADLYHLHARRTIGRALFYWLKRHDVCVTEFMHRPDLVQKLAAADMDRQHAIQKVAFAMARGHECSLDHMSRSLKKLVDRAVARVRRLSKSGKLPKFHKSGYLETLDACAGIRPTAFVLRHAIANGLAKADGWNGKVKFLCKCFSEAMQADGGLEVVVEPLDEFISEIAALPHAIASLCPAQTLGGRLDQITNLVTGRSENLISEAAMDLAEAIASGRLPLTQNVLVAQIFEDLGGPRRLIPEDFVAEVELNRSLAQRLMRANESLIPMHALQEAFIARSERLLTPDSIDKFIRASSNDAVGQLFAMLHFEESIVGEHNKSRVAGYILGLMAAHNTRSWFLDISSKPLERMAKLAQAQRKVMASDLDPADCLAISRMMDQLCHEAMDRMSLLSGIMDHHDDPVEAAVRMVRLVEQGVVTHGVSSDAVARTVLNLLKSKVVRQRVADGDEMAIAGTRRVGRILEELRQAS